MRKISILILLISITFNAFSQKQNEKTKLNKEKLKALKVAHITEKLNLSEKESQAFWPIYNENENKRAEIRASKLGKLKPEEINALSTTEADITLKKIIKLEEKRQQQEKEYQKKLLRALPAKKILLLKHADRSFRLKVLQEYKGRHKKHGEKN